MVIIRSLHLINLHFWTYVTVQFVGLTADLILILYCYFPRRYWLGIMSLVVCFIFPYCLATYKELCTCCWSPLTVFLIKHS